MEEKPETIDKEEGGVKMPEKLVAKPPRKGLGSRGKLVGAALLTLLLSAGVFLAGYGVGKQHNVDLTEKLEKQIESSESSLSLDVADSDKQLDGEDGNKDDSKSDGKNDGKGAKSPDGADTPPKESKESDGTKLDKNGNIIPQKPASPIKDGVNGIGNVINPKVDKAALEQQAVVEGPLEAPEGWPSDVPTPKDFEIVSTSSRSVEHGHMYTMTAVTGLTPVALARFYQDNMKSHKIKVVGEGTDGTISLDGKYTVSVAYSAKEDYPAIDGALGVIMSVLVPNGKNLR